MGSLADTIKAATVKGGRIYPCIVATKCEDDADRRHVADLMSDPEQSIRSISRLIGVSEGSVFKHRSKDCACYRGEA